MYNDLENGGGSVRRRMPNRLSGVSFTYVAPPTPRMKTEGDVQLFGSWRRQIPKLYDVSDDEWREIHDHITRERMSTSPAPSSSSSSLMSSGEKPHPLMLYLPGLDGFGISATAQYDDLSNTFELWRMTVDKNDFEPQLLAVGRKSKTRHHRLRYSVKLRPLPPSRFKKNEKK